MVDPAEAHPLGIITELEEREDIGTSADGSTRQAAGQDLRHRRQIRRDPVILLAAARRVPETGHNFVEDEDNPPLAGELSDLLEILSPRAVAEHDQPGYI